MWGRWDVVLLLIAAYVAVMSLVRLMSNRRQQLTERFRSELRAEQQRKAYEAARQRRREARKRDRAA
ncbi:MAG: hypothetical protein DWQ31_04530 [Planctomycetota bacterium]|nr:MAG: hypothetical protein DWQ31_04530 [Planctomycetota bacterium]REJ95596.1 MAG: hypothetical protein DWQ35_06360 [Planctomycetota bacterium]REK22626.1 MAG: hypothetical protein DWQ42_16715 [Planctomycetota bacterium]REK48807.1 MAG: hypothetical protein DWQ46_01470 [Planctomycetota bacterium]